MSTISSHFDSASAIAQFNQILQGLPTATGKDKGKPLLHLRT